MQLWTLFNQSKQFQSRPSELVGINPLADPYTAFCFDEATFMWGRYVEGELQRSQKGATSDKQAWSKVQMRFQALMREPEEDEGVQPVEDHSDFPKHLKRTPAPGQFRDPMTLLGKKK